MIPACVNINRKHTYARRYFGLDHDRFYFIFSFDYYSGTARKNPLGVAQAFGYAFPDQKMKVGLLLKSTGPGELDPTVSQHLKNLSTIDKRITVLDRSVDRDEILSLIDDCDCYISLHRSEGFGLGMAEALALGKPVIATDYSGSRDFLTERTGFPVPFSLRKLMPGEYLMGEGQSWAEPDLEVAIQYMRTVFANRGEWERRSSYGKQFVEDHYSGQSAAKTNHGSARRNPQKLLRKKTTQLTACPCWPPQPRLLMLSVTRPPRHLYHSRPRLKPHAHSVAIARGFGHRRKK